jgi:AcrR family transcriptional regulator
MTTSKPRGRPRTFDRQAALEAAMTLFWRHGYEGTSIADLTSAMGFTPPTLYAAFGSKEQLYREVLAHYLTRGRALSEDPCAYAAIEYHLRDAAEHFTNPAKPAGCMVSTALLYSAVENEAARAAAAALRAGAFALLVAKLDRAKATGELPADTDTQALARFYSAIIQGMSVQAIDGASAADLNDFVDIALAAWPGKRPGMVQ